MKTASMPKPVPAARASPDSLRRTLLYMSGLSIACQLQVVSCRKLKQLQVANCGLRNPELTTCNPQLLYLLPITFPFITLSGLRILMSGRLDLTSTRWYLPGPPGALTVTTTEPCST